MATEAASEQRGAGGCPLTRLLGSEGPAPDHRHWTNTVSADPPAVFSTLPQQQQKALGRGAAWVPPLRSH